MRKVDKGKLRMAKTISFENWVLKRLERQAAEEETTVSNLVNFFCRNYLMNDMNYARMMAKHHYLEFQKWQYAKGQIEARLEVQQ